MNLSILRNFNYKDSSVIEFECNSGLTEIQVHKTSRGFKNIIEKVYQLNRNISSFTPKKITMILSKF